MEPHQHHPYGIHVDTTGGGGGGGGGGDRFPQWSLQETRDFLMIRSELDPTFVETKRNKLLWEAIATRMREKGYNRSAEQCKCKWKNLVTRYKACETMESESSRQQFPFYNELQSIFAARIQRMLWMEAEGGASGSKKRSGPLSSDDDEDDNEDSDHGEKSSAKKRRKVTKGTKNQAGSSSAANSSGNVVNSLREILEEFMKQQMEMEMEWLKAYETREEERKRREIEWRQTMEALENERLMMERRWRERDEQRKIREEARAEKRDALITALLHKLRRNEDL